MNDTNQLYFLALLGLAFLLIGILSGIVVYLLLKSKDKTIKQVTRILDRIYITIK